MAKMHADRGNEELRSRGLRCEDSSIVGGGEGAMLLPKTPAQFETRGQDLQRDRGYPRFCELSDVNAKVQIASSLHMKDSLGEWATNLAIDGRSRCDLRRGRGRCHGAMEVDNKVAAAGPLLITFSRQVIPWRTTEVG